MTFSTAAVDPNYLAPQAFPDERLRRVGATDDELQTLFDAHQRRSIDNRVSMNDWIRSHHDDDVRALLDDWRSKHGDKAEVQAVADAPDTSQPISAVLEEVGDDPQKAAAAAAAERSGQNRTTLLAQLDKIASSGE